MIHIQRTPSVTGVGTYVQTLTEKLPGVTFEKVNKKEWSVGPMRVGGILNRVLCNLDSEKVSNSSVRHASCNWSFDSNCNSVMVHDLNPLIFPSYRVSRLMFQFQRKHLKNSVLFTPSHSTKEGLMRWLEIDPDSIAVAHHGYDTNVFYPRQIDLGFDYLIYSGGYRQYKLIEEGIELASRLGLHFVRTGPPWESHRGHSPENSDYGRSVYEYGIKKLGNKFHDCGFVSREKLAGLYSGAVAMWFRSKWEGFGLPALEAAACGTPSILADTPVANEIHRETGIYNNITSVKDLEVDSVEVVRNAHRFTWDKSIKAHLDRWKQEGLL